MTPQQIIEAIEGCKLALTEGNTRYKTLMITLANREYHYRISVAKEELSLRAQKLPGNLVYDIARGTPEVAKLRLQRDIAKNSCGSMQRSS